MKKYIDMESNKQFRKEHQEALHHNRGQYSKSEVRGLLRTYKKAGYAFESAVAELMSYAQKSGTVMPEEKLLQLWWSEIR